MLKPSNHRLIRALLRQPVDTVPIWLMRQAGRYLPEYRVLRQQVTDFMTFCKTPELATTATLQPLQRFDLDAAIVFSDILVVPQAMGMSLEFVRNEGPVFQHPLRCAADIEQLQVPDVEEACQFVLTTISWVVKALDGRVPLIGFAGSPWTCAAYMLEGRGTRTFEMARRFLYTQPQLTHVLLQKITQFTINYLQAQIAAGVQVVMLFDTWGGMLAYQEYMDFSLHYMQQIAAALTLKSPVTGETVPLIFFTKGGSSWLESIANTDCDAIGLDWTIDLAQAHARVGAKKSLQGNIDPALLFAQPVHIEKAVQKLLGLWTAPTGYVANLGHGILQHTPVEHVQVLIDAVRQYGRC